MRGLMDRRSVLALAAASVPLALAAPSVPLTLAAASVPLTLAQAASSPGAPASPRGAGKAAPAGQGSSPGATSVNIRDFGAAGDGIADDTVPIQAAIDFAQLNRLQTVVVPEGLYRTTDTLHLGYGETFHSVSLLGPVRAAYAASLAGAAIVPDMTDRPAINVQGGRNITISGLALKGKLGPHIEHLLFGAENFSADPADYLDAALAPHGLDPFRPYAAITVDAYAGPKPVAGYPDPVYPAWTGLLTPYRKAFSSAVHVQNCEIAGFAVGFANQPCDSDGNADFTRIRDCQFSYCVYAIAICNGQSRNVELRDLDYAACHTFITTGHFGRKIGQLGGPIDNISGGAGYQFLDIPTPGYTGAVRVSNLYFERQVRIGAFGSGAAWPAPLVFDSCMFSFGTQPVKVGGTGRTAIAALESSVGGAVTFRQCAFSQFDALIMPVYFKAYAVGSSTPALVFENCVFTPGNLPTPSSVTPALAQAINWFGGAFVQGLSNRTTRILGAITGTYWHMSNLAAGPTSQPIAESLVPPGNGERLIVNPAAREFADIWGRPWRIASEPEIAHLPSAQWISAPIKTGLGLSGIYSAAVMDRPEVWSGYKIVAGDILWNAPSGHIYVVERVEKNTSAGHYNVTAVLINDCETAADGTRAARATTGGTMALVLVKTGRRFSPVLYYGNFTAGSAAVTDVHRGDGFAGDLTEHVRAGDPLPQTQVDEPSYHRPARNGTVIVSVQNGSPGAVTLSKPARSTGRYPLLPIEVA